MLLKVEGQRAFEVDVSVRDRGDVAHVLLGAVPIGAFWWSSQIYAHSTQ